MTETPAPSSENATPRPSRTPLFIGLGALVAAALIAGGVWFAVSQGDDGPALVYAGPEEIIHFDAEGAEIERIASPLTADQQTGGYPLGQQVGGHALWVSDSGIVGRDLATGEVVTYDGDAEDTVLPVRGSSRMVSIGPTGHRPGDAFSVIDVESGAQVELPTTEDSYFPPHLITGHPDADYVAASDLTNRITYVVPMDGTEAAEMPGALVGIDDAGPVVAVLSTDEDPALVLNRLEPDGGTRESVPLPVAARPLGLAPDGTVLVQDEDLVRLWRPGADRLEEIGLQVGTDQAAAGAVPGSDRTVVYSPTGVTLLDGDLEQIAHTALDGETMPSFVDAVGGCLRVDVRGGESLVLDTEDGTPLVGEPTRVAFATMGADPCTPVLQPEPGATSLTLPGNDGDTTIDVPSVQGILGQLRDGSAVVARTEDATLLISLTGEFDPVDLPAAGATGTYWRLDD